MTNCKNSGLNLNRVDQIDEERIKQVDAKRETDKITHRHLCNVITIMIWNIHFSRSRFASWVSPGYHGEWKDMTGQTVTAANGIKARLVKVEYNLPWQQISKHERACLKQQYGENVKQDYHRFTRITFDRTLWEQPMLPMFE